MITYINNNIYLFFLNMEYNYFKLKVLYYKCVYFFLIEMKLMF